jgi:putative ABC transport system substrate-binding protein
MQSTQLPVQDTAGIERAIASLGRDAVLVVMPDTFAAVHRDLIVASAAQYRVPAIYPFRFFITAGGLISYGIDLVDLYRRAASYVDRILKGTKPAELPVELPTKFELVVNLKTAKALGLKIQESFLVRADEVIE